MLKRIFAWLLLPLLLVSPARAAEKKSIDLPVVMYHHISKDPARWNDYVLSPEELECDLRWLRAHGYEAVRVSELLAWQDGRFEMPEKPVMITFDDGYESTQDYAEPLLRQYGYCGVVAVIGSVCEAFSALDEHDAELSNLSWEDVRAMAERGTIEVQCHTWDLHTLWPRRGCGRIRGESDADCRAALTKDLRRFLKESEAHGIQLVPAIAYPYGSYDKTVTADAVCALGFRAAFTCTEKVNRLTGDAAELYDLGRYNRPHGVTSEKFFAKWEENS